MSKSLTVEIHGTGTINRGAELMAIAISARLRQEFPDIRLIVPMNFGNAFQRCKYNFYTTAEFGNTIKGRIATGILAKMHERIALPFGLIEPDQIDMVIDASGFAFSDQMGSKSAELLLTKMFTSARRSKPLVLLPQALGPFKNNEVLRTSKKLFERASLIFARDQVSFAAAKELVNDPNKLFQSPDFTVGICGEMDHSVELPEKFVAIVPNYRMIDKGQFGKSYELFLKKTIEDLFHHNQNPVWVIHDSMIDLRVISSLKEQGIQIPVISHDDPRVLKFILGKSEFVIGSRFHSLVSALSQGIPCIGAGWSHKYPELFLNFDCPDLLLSDLNNDESRNRLIDQMVDVKQREVYAKAISNATINIKKQNDEMWERVVTLIRQCT